MPSGEPVNTRKRDGLAAAMVVVIACAISWALFGLYLLGKRQEGLAGLQALGFAAKFGPSIAGLVVAAWLLPAGAVEALVRRTVRWRFALRWWLFVLLGPVMIVLGAVLIYALLDDAVTWEGGAEAWAAYPLRLARHVFLGGGLGEELGWRGVMLAALLRWRSPLTASVLVGLPWALWHLPTLLEGEPGDAAAFFIYYTPAVILISVLLTQVYLATGGSVLACILFHAGINASEWVVTDRMLTADAAEITGTGLSIGAGIAAAAILVVLANWRRWVTVDSGGHQAPGGPGTAPEA